MAFEAVLNRIRQIKADIISNREAEVLRIAFDQLALIKLRIQSSGEDFQNTPFVPYSKPYSKERAKAGYQIEFVDYTRTGRFFAGIRPKIVSSSIFSATVEIGPDDERGKDILQGAKSKRGDILRASKEEIDFVKKANRERLLKHLKF